LASVNPIQLALTNRSHFPTRPDAIMPIWEYVYIQIFAFFYPLIIESNAMQREWL